MWHRLAIGLLLTCLCGPAIAQDSNCLARVNGQDVVIKAGMVVDGRPSLTLREKVLSWPRLQWNRVWGRPAPCDSQTTITFLGAVLAFDQTAGYCLSWDAASEGYLLVPGERNFRGRCSRTVCDRVNIARDQTTAFAGAMLDAVLRPPQSGLLGLTHSSGAVLLTGQPSLMLDALGTGATNVSAALSSPSIAPTAAVTLLALGGAVYLCHQ